VSVDVLEWPSHEVDAACALFASVFGLAISPTQWRWKYEAGPRLGRINVAARDDSGRWVGHAGAIVFPGACRGRALPMAQVCDIMVARDARGGLDVGGVYPRLIAALRRLLRERFPGVFAYGFPGTRPFRLGERMGFYRRLYDCREAIVETSERSGWATLSRCVSESEWDPARLDRIWARLPAAQSGPTVARTGSYLTWRYRDHPTNAYRLWILRRWFRDAGWLVTRTMPDGAQWVVDAMLPDPSEASAACMALRSRLADQAAATVPLHTWLPLTPKPGVRVEATPIVATEFLAEAWRTDLPPPAFQPGDTDVF